MIDSSANSSREFRGPDIIVIGAMRCATTSLYEILRLHPEFEVTSVKESDFYLPNEFKGGLTAFRKLVSRTDLPIVDISPNYSNLDLWPGTATRIFQTNPSAKLIYIVRDPVERAISAYNTLYLWGHDLPLPESILGTHAEKETVAASQYAAQLKPYLEYWDLEEICIVDYSELIARPAATVAEMMTAIGYPCDASNIEGAKSNESGSMTSMPKSWARLRNTNLGRRVRRWMPHKVGQRVKSLVFAATPSQPPPPIFTETAKAKLARHLKPDADAFRTLTGLPFDHWSI